MLLTAKGRYAVMAAIEIASSDKSPISLLKISERQDISLSYLEQIFANLKKYGIVKSVKGPGGGYVLGRKASEISIAEIIRATGENIKMTRCNDKNGCVKKNNSKCKTHNLWYGLENNIYNYLNSISLESICN